ncbi:hypothetical protein CHS0354_009680 [Potamilus streckersoni]|uniref:Vitellogenin domain-containing protein n=1 Tax=Potamilus streckersoni TaxID=2493646 RepID=A0AAE0SM62_9BIVA|nr:hypothetical protein CHS0354_009680 [Potamilus streckersoni]
MAFRQVVDIRVFVVVYLIFTACAGLSYEKGKVYKYTYDTDIRFNDHYSQKKTKPQGDVGLHLSMDFDFVPIFQDADGTQLVKLQVTNALLSSPSRSGIQGTLVDMVQLPVFFEYNDGVVGKVFVVDADSIFCSNVKKGIISMFQLMTEPGERTEIDVSGECHVVYDVSGDAIIKKKESCENLEIKGQHENSNQLFGVSTINKSTWTYQLENNLIHSVMGSNRVIASLNIKSSLNVVAMAVQKLTLLSASPSTEVVSANSVETVLQRIVKATGHGFAESLLPSGLEVQHCTENCEKPLEVLTRLKDSLVSEKLATTESAKAYLEMLKTFRNAGKNTIEEVLTSRSGQYIVAQLIDVAAGAQTTGSHNAVMGLVNFEDEKYITYPQRFLLAAAYATHPGEYLVKDLMNLMKKPLPNQTTKESVVLALGAVIHTYCQDSTKCADENVQDYKRTVLGKLERCKGKESCILMYLRSMENAGLPDLLPSQLKIASEANSSMVAYIALHSLRRIPQQHFKDEETTALLKIYHQKERRYDISVRAAAVDILLKKNPSSHIIRNILLTATADQRDFELSTYVNKRLIDQMKSDNKLRSVMASVLEDIWINNYHVMSQRGKSSAFSSLLAETQDTNCTYGLYMQMSRTGVMKRSSMIVDLVGENSRQPFLNFGIYAEGLESLLSEETDPSEEGVEATAGMGLTLMDVLLPPVEFFRGSGGLMSAVWNAPSEPVSALQANLLLQDHSHRFHLANGLIVELQVLGVASIDLSGSVSISLWNRNSKSNIRNSGALVIEGTMKLEGDIGRAGMSFMAEGEAYIDFNSDVDFYETPFKMCMQMIRPPLTFKHTIRKHEFAKQFGRGYRARLTKNTHITGVSYFLNEKNSEECKVLIQ